MTMCMKYSERKSLLKVCFELKTNEVQLQSGFPGYLCRGINLFLNPYINFIGLLICSNEMFCL